MTIAYVPAIAPSGAMAERTDLGDAILSNCLRAAAAGLNPSVPSDALEESFRRPIRLDGEDADPAQSAVHRLLVDGVPVE